MAGPPELGSKALSLPPSSQLQFSLPDIFEDFASAFQASRRPGELAATALSPVSLADRIELALSSHGWEEES